MLTKAHIVPAMPLLLAVASLPLLYALGSGRAALALPARLIRTWMSAVNVDAGS